MSYRSISNIERVAWPRWWRWTLLALSTLILCSCSPTRHKMSPNGPAMDAAMTTMRPAPGAPLGNMIAPGACCESSPQAMYANGPWTPPGIGGPWPADEYLCDGGDAEIPASVDANWQIYGLGIEDTIAHFDTLDAQRIVEPSNPVCIYAPRFAAVRSVSGLNQNDQVAAPVGVEQPLKLRRSDEVQIAATGKQNLAPYHQTTLNRVGAYQMNQSDGIVATTLKAVAFHDAFLPFENLSIQADEARLAESHEAAITWTGDQEVQIILDLQRAAADLSVDAAQQVYIVDRKLGPAKLRLYKIASCRAARPGDTVDFTLRYDNVGASTIGNVTIVDNLTTRLAFVPGTSQSSRDANFLTETNEADSLVLRWEIIDPLEPGEGGVIRFRCRLR